MSLNYCREFLARYTQATTKLALRLLLLTAVRPGIVRGARWDEIYDLDGPAPHWIIPAARMKLEQKRKADQAFDHPVPLSTQAVEILRALATLTGAGDLCFPGARFGNRPISENTLNAYLRRGGYCDRHTAHGCRAAFSTVMNERPDEVTLKNDRLAIDLMLGHRLTKKSGEEDRRAVAVSSSESAYNRAKYMPRRRELAQEWADMIMEGVSPPRDLIGGRVRYAKDADRTDG